ncbi:MAG: hypothetical protein ABT11_00540 [Novosphingobium sp. SCN 66-18]|nr:MAG: hypothetical protein ABT11_00540 [Novosphingobium sp. SCN 66-18]
MQKIYVVDDREGCRAQMCSHLFSRGFHAEPFDSVDEAVRMAHDDAVFLVHDGNDMIADAALKIAIKGQRLPIIAYCRDMDAQRIITAALNGAKSYLVWPFTDAEFTGAVDDAIARVNWNHAGDSIAQYKVGLLSDREKSIVQGVVEGQSSREIAQRLGVSARTVEACRGKIMKKFGAGRASEMVRIAVEGGVTPGARA